MTYILTPLEHEIEKMYLSLGIYQPDQIELCDIAAKLNIWVHFEPVRSRALDNAGLHSIIIDSRISESKQWEDFGHELNHILHHGGCQLNMPESFREFQEIKANNFALHFCVPTFMILDSGLPYTWNEAILFVMDTYNVTEKFARKRLEHFNKQVIGFEFHIAFKEALLIK
jgi:hypothetical protein